MDNKQKNVDLNNNDSQSSIDNTPKKYGKGQNPNSRKNLISLADRTREERVELGRKGGLKSGEKKREQKTMRQTLESALRIELSQKKLKDLGADLELMNGETSVLSAIVASALREAINGDTKSLQIIRDTIGEMPVTKTENITEVITSDDAELMDGLKKALTS